jgi:hypothetical protein
MTARLTQLAFACVVALPAVAAADIYRCVSPEGLTTYSDSPCPGSAAMSANVTELIGLCESEECAAQRDQAHAAAVARLETEKAMVQQMQAHRLQAEALDLDRRVRLEELRRLTEFDAAQREMSSGIYYPGYPLVPGYGYGFGGFGHRFGDGFRPECKGVHCDRFPGVRPPGRHQKFRREPPVRKLQ